MQMKLAIALIVSLFVGCSSSSGSDEDGDASGDATTIDLAFGGDSDEPSDDVAQDPGSGDGGVDDTGTDANDDVGEQDSGDEDGGAEDLGNEDTGVEDSGSEDTGSHDTVAEDTATDTGSDGGGSEDVTVDTGSSDTGSVDTGSDDGIEDVAVDTGERSRVYTVGEFPVSDWSLELSRVTTTAINEIGAEEASRDGDPGRFRGVSVKFGPGTGSRSYNIHVLSWLNDATYSAASDGAVSTIDWALSAQHGENDEPANRPVLVSLLIRQGDTDYYLDPARMTEAGGNINCRWIWMDDGDECQKAGWNTKRYTGFEAEAFLKLQGTGSDHPDFSASGEKLEFGYAVIYTTTLGSATVSREVGVDNFTVRLNLE